MKKVLAVILAIGLCVAPQAGYAYQYGSGWNERDLEMRKFSIDGDKDDGLAFDGNNDDVNDMVLSPTGSLILGDVTYPYSDGAAGQGLVTDGAGSLSWASLQPLSTNLTSLSGLTYASPSFVKMTGANTFSLDTNTYLTAETDPNAVLLAGRAGGQTIKGGTQAGDDLSFWTNATGTVGSYFFTDLTDNGFIKTSGGTGLLSVDTTTYLSAEADTLDAVTDRGATTTNNITIGTLTSGVEDTTRGIAYFHGPEAGYDFGGSAFFYTGADHDTTIDNYGIIAHQDDLLIGPSNDTDALKLVGSDLSITSGSLTVGDDVTITDDLFLGSGSVINFDSGNATITHSAGILTFNVFPVTPSAAPDADYEVANKKFVDDHNWDAGDITSGTLVHERGGLEADVSAYDGFVKISGGVTSAVTANAGTDITADLEEETHAAEHAVSAADTVFPADPGADRYLMWDDDPGALVWAEVAGVAGDVTDVGNCSGGACLDGSSDGGTSISLYDGNSHKTTITAGDSTGDLAFTLPTTDGDANQVLKTDGSGVLSWVANGSFDSTTVDATTWSDGANAANIWTFDVSGTDTTLTFGNDVITVGGSLTVTTGKNITLGSTQWNASGEDTIDGEKIADDTIDDDAIDFSDVTGADLTLTDCGAITAGGLLTANANLDVKNGATSAGVISIYEDSDDGAHKTTITVPALAADVAYVLPADDGDAGEQLQTDGSGNLTWEAAGGAAAAGWTDGGSYIKTTTDGDSVIIGGATAVGTSGTSVLAIEVGTAPSTSPADMVQLYAVDGAGALTEVASSATASAATVEINTAANLNDGNTTTALRITDGDGNYFKFDFGSGVTKRITRLGLYNNDNVNYSPDDFLIQGSNDDSSYTTLETVTNLGMSLNTWAYVDFTNATAYRYYRVMNIHSKSETSCWCSEVRLYEATDGTAELTVRDEAGNVTTLSPHNFKDIPSEVVQANKLASDDMAWTYHSEKDGKSITVDMFRAIRALEKLTGEQLIFTNEEASVDKTPGDITVAELITAKAELETTKTELATTKKGLEKAQADIAKLTTDVTDLKSAEPIEEPIK